MSYTKIAVLTLSCALVSFSELRSQSGFSSTPAADSMVHKAYLFTSKPYDTAGVDDEFFRSYYQNDPEVFRYLLTVKKISHLRAYTGNCLSGFISTEGNDIKRLYHFVREKCPEHSYLVPNLYNPDPVNLKLIELKSSSDSITYSVRTESGTSLPHRVRFTNREGGEDGSDREIRVTPTGSQYEVKAHRDERVKVDSRNELPDVNLLDNQPGLPAEFKFNPFIAPEMQVDNYVVDWRPDLWYNAYDGFKAGAVMNGSYMNQLHNFTLRAFYNTGIEQEYLTPADIANDFDPVNFIFDYDTYLRKGLRFNADARLLDGLQSSQAGLDYLIPGGKSMFYGFFRTLYRPDISDLEYLLIKEWGIGNRNHKLHVGFSHKYDYDNGYGDINIELASSSLGSDYNFAYLVYESKHQHSFGKIPFRYRLFGQYGTGDHWAPESRLFLAGANPEGYMDDPFTRSQGIINRSLSGNFTGDLTRFHYGGGLNLRGYSGYFAPHETEDGDILPGYAGTTGASVNAELPFTPLLFSRRTKLDSYVNFEAYLFGDAGMINVNRPGEDLAFADLRADAGIGGSMEILRFGKFDDLKPLTLRVDLPLFLNRPPAGQEYLAFRFLLGINKAF